jgi:uncharacterized damage-inducible protein DinB
MNPDIALYASQLKLSFERLREIVGGLTESQLNWRPSFAEANSIYVIATHMLGNAQGWVLGICCGEPIDRDRPAEFRASGATAAPLLERAQELSARIEAALARLDAAALDDEREARQQLWGAGTARPVTGREALMHAVDHFSIHLGQLQITRDLALAQA